MNSMNILEDTDEISLELKVNKQEIEHVNRQNGNCDNRLAHAFKRSQLWTHRSFTFYLLTSKKSGL